MRLEGLKEEIWKCNHCSMCSEMVCDAAGYYKVCPVYQVKRFENYTARGHNTLALYLLEGSLNYDQDLAEILFSCTTCMTCEEVCKPMGNAVAGLGGSGLKSILNEVIRPLAVNMDPIPSVGILETMRADCVDRGMVPDGLRAAAENVAQTGNIYGEPAKNSAGWSGGIPRDKGAGTLLFAGETAAFRAPQIAAAALKVLRRAGMQVDVLEEERSSGALMFRSGHLDLAGELARRNIAVLKERGVRELIVLSADDYYTIVRDWPRAAGELPFAVRHLSMVLADLLRRGRLRPSKRIERRVTYQDPCRLGRGMNIYEDPRTVLRSIPGLEFRELYPTAHAAWCFGGCGGLPLSDQALAMKLGARKLPLVAETQAEIIATACPEVRVHMDAVIRHAGGGYRSLDLVELLAESLEVD